MTREAGNGDAGYGRPGAEEPPCPCISDPALIRSAYERYLRDESNLRGGVPGKIYFPTNAGQVRYAVLEAGSRGETLTVSGARTGIVGGAVPVEGGSLLSLEKMEGEPTLFFSEEYERWAVSVPPSLTVEELESTLRAGAMKVMDGSVRAEPPHNLLYPVDPTETGASLGGTAATNASGARTFHYGPTRDWVIGLTVVLSDGSTARLERKSGGGGGTPGARAARVENSVPLIFEKSNAGGERRQVELYLTRISMPLTKHVAGYYIREGMEPIDLFIGGEGTLGIITGLDLALERRPAGIIGVSVFLPSAEALYPLLSRFRASDSFTPFALEYMDGNSLRILSEYRREAGASSGVPSFPENAAGMLYIETAYEEESAASGILEDLSGRITLAGIPEESTWAGFDADIDAMKAFRHALPERINALIARRAADVPGIAKLATDLSVPGSGFPDMMAFYGKLLGDSGLSHVLFGHIGNFHLHMNLLPATPQELERGREVCGELARHAVSLGGSVSAEHGLGKLKKHLLSMQYTKAERDALYSIKRSLDPHGILNPDVLW
jgi:D-lactate dehydrogenase (cytochrome)